MGVVKRRAVARDQLARSSVVEVTSMVMVGCGDGVLELAAVNFGVGLDAGRI